MHILRTRAYESLSLVGFSLGANLTLKYVGETGKSILPQIKSATGISAPCDLASSAREILKPKCAVYEKRFLHTMIKKVKSKESILPPNITRDYSSVKDLADFDNFFTAPLSGFKDAAEYWSKCSARRYIAGTAIPTLIINALDDPILGPECFPWEEARASSNLYLEAPAKGGHVGFITFGNGGEYWDETRAAEFAEAHL
jgi:predicted alpha/beta-fold hydrolase